MLSKSRYCAFLQCPKKLWLHLNRPELAKPNPSFERITRLGNEIGDLAMGYFGEYIEVTALKADGGLDLSAMIERTEELCRQKSPVICEASFSHGGNYCAVDILRWENGGYAIYEVKSSKEAKRHYVRDIAYQKYILEKCGVNVTGTYLIHVREGYVFDGTIDLQKMFEVVDFSKRVAKEIPCVAANVEAACQVVCQTEEPKCDLSKGCHEPHDCPFWDYCSSHLPTPSVFDLHGLRFNKKLNYYQKGMCTLDSLTEEEVGQDDKIRSLQLRHHRQDLGMHIDREGIKAFLDTLWYPLYFLDFETMQQGVPEYVGTAPYAQLPFQYSLHYLETEGGELQHKEFLAACGENPIRAVAERLCADIPQNACVLIFNKSFEPTIVEGLAKHFPDLADRLRGIKAHMKDLLEPFRQGYCYNRAMGGSLSIKSILPALFPNDPTLNYHNLAGVQNGAEAMDIFPKMASMTPEEQAAARESLLAYCKLDTYATVKVWQELVRLTAD